MKDAAMRCVLRPVDASKLCLRPAPDHVGAYAVGALLQRSPDPLDGFAGGERGKRGWKELRMERERKL